MMPVEIDYTTTVPKETIGHCCYYRRCVWSIHPISIETFVVKLLYKDYFSVDVFRTHTHITKDKESGAGVRFSRDMYSAAVRYAILRGAGYTHKEAMNDVLIMLPKPVRLSVRALQYFENTVLKLVENAEKLAKLNVHKAPKTGWSVLRDETYTLEPLFFPASFLPKILAYSFSLPKIYTNLVFCDDHRCYPTPNGIWPDDKWLLAVGQSLRHDVYFRFIEEFGAVSILEYLTNLDIDEIAISIKPGRRWAKITLYVPVKNPEEHVVKVAKMQELTDKITRQLESLIVNELEKPIEEDGLKILGITDKDIESAIRKLYRRKKA